ncbi:MAG: hypothetical protein V7703_11930 [Hyphomicrobiales bacterium]
MQQMWIRICCACAIILAAFAHQPVALAEGGTKVAQSTLPDGTVISLCLYTPAGDDKSASPPCEFCRIAHGADVTSPCATCSVSTRFVEIQRPEGVAVDLPRAVFQPATPLRGPPSLA